ncbi:YkuS family protein [Gracilibacillus sp. YIM 98692]|uniref:YkuS family protein n=1 Tax=Gracilibacillus sp. YIM 98692 TaxID=2663532 RepID=UPI0013D52279|nr:YkuS family protein [Gracilibacillus sp. YIM 98692]
MARIGVEESLTDVQQKLQEDGHEVITLRQEQDANGCDCCIVSGQDQNMMGMQDTSIQGAVISAQGLSANDISQEIQQRLQQQQ